MKQKVIAVLIGSLALWFGVSCYATPVEANDGTGGQVNRNGKISFYEETIDSSSSDNSSKESAKDTSIKLGTKSTGKSFPNTGDQQKKYGFLGYGLVLVALGLFFLRQRSKEENQ